MAIPIATGTNELEAAYTARGNPDVAPPVPVTLVNRSAPSEMDSAANAHLSCNRPMASAARYRLTTAATTTGAMRTDPATIVRNGTGPSSGRRSGPPVIGLSIVGNRCKRPGWTRSQTNTTVSTARNTRPTLSQAGV